MRRILTCIPVVVLLGLAGCGDRYDDEGLGYDEEPLEQRYDDQAILENEPYDDDTGLDGGVVDEGESFGLDQDDEFGLGDDAYALDEEDGL